MILINILVAILFAGLGVCAGIIYMCVKNIKELNEILAGVDKLEAEYKKQTELSDGVIKRLELIAELRLSMNNLYEQDLSDIHDHLVHKRDVDGVKGLDDIIGHIATILSDDDDEPEEGSSDE
jgi:hypothetical protein